MRLIHGLGTGILLILGRRGGLRGLPCGLVVLGLAVAGLLGGPLAARPAGAETTIIRDAEVEGIIRDWTVPLFRAAGLAPETLRLRIIADDQLNAFTTGQGRLFLNTGTLAAAETPDEIIGVIAHEVGHMAGGDVIKLKDQIEQAQVTSLITALLGAAAGAATGRGDVASGIMLGGQGVAMGQFFGFSRTQEAMADSFALRVLDDTGQSAQGLLTFFERLGDQDLLPTSSQALWARTHPLTGDRIAAVRHHVETTSAEVRPAGPDEQARHARMVAKLTSFLKSFGLTMRQYPPEDTSLPARYARAIAYYRHNDLKEALVEIDGLLADHPDDPYFHELKGQMLFENGRLEPAVASYRRAVELAPGRTLIILGLAHALVESGRPEDLAEAQEVLSPAVSHETDNPFAWWLVANAYGKDGKIPMAAYAEAERAILLGKPEEALYHVRRAMSETEKGTPFWFRLEDAEAEAENLKEKMARQR
ncbi:M48 family metalloprotease [Roseospirillum parvum]|uniref:Putative Zn-dependent protease, contains TPR repeats n=1 Tax=Roseospirillum parvum TaxID=83401 RepID=A0A1G7XRL2_9PROT|nr:M48 family metalloprotease [Roseospirillum parvum]SDG86798.1 Putative Zn-dependent protease, contains TPR repeats [Roseospirillum parvum]